MESIRGVAVLFALFVLSLSASAATLVVLNKSEHTASLIDPDSGKTLATLPVGRGPHEVIVSPDGRTAYVSNFGPYGICPAADTLCKTPGNTITVLDLAKRKVKATYDYGSNKGQHGSEVSRDGKYVWVTSETPQSLLEIDTATGKIVNQWLTKQERSHLVVVTPDEKKFYVSNTVSGSVSVIERANGAVKVIPIGKGAEAITISPDGREVWAGMPVDNKIAVISTANDEIAETLDSGGKQPQRIRFTPDGREVWVTRRRRHADRNRREEPKSCRECERRQTAAGHRVFARRAPRLFRAFGLESGCRHRCPGSQARSELRHGTRSGRHRIGR